MDLPPPDAPFNGVIADTIAQSTPDWPRRTRPPQGAPNVVVVVLDDLGFGHLSCYGGPIEAPNIAALAANGLRYNNFHTTALCSPTRAALLTGRNHHSVGFAAIAEMASGFPGANSYLPRSAVSVAEVLRQSGYSTFCCGKWHLTPSAEITAAGPFERWPLGLGFERFYGFLGGEVDQWHPMLTVDNHRIPTPEHDGYHLSEDLVDQAIGMVRDQQQIATGRPFFLYLPFGAPHCPLHAPASYIDAYRGRFDDGWDVERERTFARQKALGIVPAETELAPRNGIVKPWAELDADTRRLFARLQETFCGFVDHTDAQIGRLVSALREMEVLDNTLILLMSDNGASQEGQHNGTINTERFRNLMPMDVAEMLPALDRIGGPDTDPHYPMGWGMAGNTPFRRWKRDTHRGGNTDPLIAHWPARIADPGAIRGQYLHVTDIYPTLLELAQLPVPVRVNGVEQKPLEGHSFARTLTEPVAGTARTRQYYEMLGSRAIWQDGWTAVTWHKPGTDWQDDRWELYHQEQDFSQARDLAAQHPDRLRAMVEVWWQEARKYQVLPLDDRGRERFIDPSRPRASEARPSYRYYPGTAPVPNPAMPRTLGVPHRYRAVFTLDRPGDGGLLAAQGGNLNGWALYVRDAQLVYVHNCLQMTQYELRGVSALAVGAEVQVELVCQPRGRDRADYELIVDGHRAASLAGAPVAPFGSSFVQEGLQIGRSWGPSLAPAHYHGEFAFTGRLRHVELMLDSARD